MLLSPSGRLESNTVWIQTLRLNINKIKKERIVSRLCFGNDCDNI